MIAMDQVVAVVLATFLAFHGLKRKSLSPSGSAAAFVIGGLMMANELKTFGVSLIIFYLVGSRVTKVGKALKGKLEEGHQEAGYRNAWQVFCNSFTAFLASLLWTALFTKDSFARTFLPFNLAAAARTYNSGLRCPVDESFGQGWSRFLIFATLGHFACCLGDTMASELGILSKSAPFLITTWRRVPPGTNGGVSALGTLASVTGGVIMGITMSISLIMESSACSTVAPTVLRDFVSWGAFGGLVGSLIDSLMGATIQRTRFSTKTKRILQDDTIVEPGSNGVETISGINILTNNQINLLSSILTALTIAYLA
ncbi:hypothetical protein SCHPADRAFT_910857 [Schizopora paradoxa]|uniref:DUF92-domain-containing protein n=1 Tax=Schizopora paradoxa TaxID=27342 RepID=A0A0H2R858_9AGAM|nr:hypothetical protein SCHPADRAFT_910857 [Schizopora paradoxa]